MLSTGFPQIPVDSGGSKPAELGQKRGIWDYRPFIGENMSPAGKFILNSWGIVVENPCRR